MKTPDGSRLDYPPARWEALGAALIRRRCTMTRDDGTPGGYHIRAEFCRRPGALSSQLVLALERGKRTNYEPSTLTRAEACYQLQDGAIANYLSGVTRVLHPGEPGRTATARRLRTLENQLADRGREYALTAEWAAAELTGVVGRLRDLSARLRDLSALAPGPPPPGELHAAGRPQPGTPPPKETKR